MNRSKIFILLLVAPALIAIGCEKATNEPDYTGSPNPAPKEGSTFSYRMDDTVSGQASSDTKVVTYVDSNRTYGDRQNVHVYASSKGDTTYVFHESNGNVSYFIGFPIISQFTGKAGLWVTLPFSGQPGSDLVLYDSAVSYGGVPGRFKIRLSTERDDTDSINVNGKMYFAQIATARFAAEIYEDVFGQRVFSVDALTRQLAWIPELRTHAHSRTEMKSFLGYGADEVHAETLLSVVAK